MEIPGWVDIGVACSVVFLVLFLLVCSFKWDSTVKKWFVPEQPLRTRNRGQGTLKPRSRMKAVAMGGFRSSINRILTPSPSKKLSLISKYGCLLWCTRVPLPLPFPTMIIFQQELCLAAEVAILGVPTLLLPIPRQMVAKQRNNVYSHKYNKFVYSNDIELECIPRSSSSNINLP